MVRDRAKALRYDHGVDQEIIHPISVGQPFRAVDDHGAPFPPQSIQAGSRPGEVVVVDRAKALHYGRMDGRYEGTRDGMRVVPTGWEYPALRS